MKKTLLFIAACCMATPLLSQKITITNGSIDFVKNQKILQFAFTYENMNVGRMTETQYVEKKVSEYNEKEPGRGDRWREAWIGDRDARFVPKFKELFDKNMEPYGTVSDDVNNQNAEYRVEVNTDFTEPGFNVGVVRRNAAIHLTCKVFRIASGEEVATIKVNNASANNFWGTDFDTGFRIQECYAKAGRELAKFFVKKAKLSKTK